MERVIIGALLWLVVASGSPAESRLQFRDASESAGIADPAVNSTGPVFGDYDNDGDVDIYVPTEAHQPGQDNRLWENNGRGVFRNVAPDRGVDNAGSYSRGAAWGDYDNDGDLDLVVANMPPGTGQRAHVPTTLYRNMLVEIGTADFENVTRQAGLMRAGNERDARIGGIGDTGAGVAWADYDNDGFVDLVWKCADGHIDNALFRNNGDGTFSDVTAQAGVEIVATVGEANSQGSPNWTDVDGDGWVDLLLTNEGAPNVLLLNKQDGTFADITRSRRPPSGIPFVNPGNAEGACIGDLDNDGDQDFYLPHADQGNRMILSELNDAGVVSFKDVTVSSNTADMGGARGCTLADFDNDGDLDIYVNNGGLSNVLINDVIKQMPTFVQFYIAWEPAENKLYRNDGGLVFTDITAAAGVVGLGIGSGVASADVNGDGFVDLFATNRTYYSNGRLVNVPQQSWLWLSEGNDNHWIRIKLKGTRGNRDAYGARVAVKAGDLVQVRERTSAHGYNSADDPVLGFGLGGHRTVDLVEVTWPGGGVQRFQGLATKRLHVLSEE